jgi:hypothetical protein
VNSAWFCSQSRNAKRTLRAVAGSFVGGFGGGVVGPMRQLLHLFFRFLFVLIAGRASCLGTGGTNESEPPFALVGHDSRQWPVFARLWLKARLLTVQPRQLARRHNSTQKPARFESDTIRHTLSQATHRDTHFSSYYCTKMQQSACKQRRNDVSSAAR